MGPTQGAQPPRPTYGRGIRHGAVPLGQEAGQLSNFQGQQGRWSTGGNFHPLMKPQPQPQPQPQMAGGINGGMGGNAITQQPQGGGMGGQLNPQQFQQIQQWLASPQGQQLRQALMGGGGMGGYGGGNFGGGYY